jgi:hypothetical protein
MSSSIIDLIINLIAPVFGILPNLVLYKGAKLMQLQVIEQDSSTAGPTP